MLLARTLPVVGMAVVAQAVTTTVKAPAEECLIFVLEQQSLLLPVAAAVKAVGLVETEALVAV